MAVLAQSAEGEQEDQSESEKVEAGPRQKPIGAAERLLVPITDWLENKAHRSTVLNPRAQTDSSAKRKSYDKMRSAIETAQRQYPGTVLSAERQQQSDSVFYKIKILSAQGILKEVSVSEDDIRDENTISVGDE